MPPRTRLVASPPSQIVDTPTGAYRMAASRGGPVPMPAPTNTAVAAAIATRNDPEPEPVADDAWAAEVARREKAAGIAAPPVHTPPAQLQFLGGRAAAPILHTVDADPPPDLSGLPDRFSLEVERKPDGWWKVTAPGTHIGLFISHTDLCTALADAPGALAQIVRLDGTVPRGRRRGK